MRRPDRLLIALSLALAGPAVAKPTLSPSVAGPVSPDELRQALAASVAYGRDGDCASALGVLDPLLIRFGPGAERSLIQRLRLPCLAESDRVAELASAQRELAKASPHDGFVRFFGVIVALGEARFADAAEQLAVMAEDDPHSLTLVSGDRWRAIAQKLMEGNHFDVLRRVTVVLARVDWQPKDRPDMREGLAQGAIQALLLQNQVDEATALLGRVEMPELLYAMATERLYQPLWPEIEARMGPHAGVAVDRFAADRLEDFARTPDSPRVVRDAIRSFILLGRYADANEIGGGIEIVDGMDEDSVAGVRYQAQALTALGRRDEAVRRLSALAALDQTKTPQAVSSLVALAELLDESGQHARAVTVAREAAARGGGALSRWGLAWLKRTEVCGLAAQGRAADAAAIADALKAGSGDNEPAAIEALLCLKRDGEAAAIAVRTLATSEGGSAIADQFQPDGAIWAPTQSRLRALWAAFLLRPDVKAAFERKARILPRPLWPQHGPRPIPRRGAPGPVA